MCLFKTKLIVGYSVGTVVNNMVLVVEALTAVNAINAFWVGTWVTNYNIT